jgi:hypothetical protein
MANIFISIWTGAFCCCWTVAPPPSQDGGHCRGYLSNGGYHSPGTCDACVMQPSTSADVISCAPPPFPTTGCLSLLCIYSYLPYLNYFQAILSSYLTGVLFWEYCMIYRGPGSPTVVWFCSSPASSPNPYPVGISSTGDTQEDRERETTHWQERGREWARSQIIRPQESLVLYKSFNTLW